MSAHSYSIATQGLAGRKIPQGTLTPMNALLFGSGEQGAWYDPSDLSTLFQDAAGTTPVTAVEQPVGRILDKSGRGNHATQATTTKRPVLSRRVNLLNKTVAGASWFAAVKTEIPNYFGEDIGFSLYQDGVGYGDSPYLQSSFPAPAGTRLTASALVDMSTVVGPGASVGLLSFNQTGGASLVRAYLSKAGAVSVGYLSGMTEVAVTRELLYGTVYLVSASGRLTQAASSLRLYCEATNLTSAVWGRPQITYATDAHLPYQWVNTATDYDADPNKFPAYLRFDGVDDALQTNAIDFTGTDKMTVWAGVNESSPAQALIVELTTFGLNTGAFSLYALSVSIFSFSSIGPSPNLALTAVTPELTNYVLTGYSDVTGGIGGVRLNGAPNTVALTGSGSHANAPLYIGSRGSSSNYLNGRLYSLVVRGAQTPLSQIEATELYIKQKMRMP